ncbi:unnamed protein product [Camellia sinensis]
MDEEVIILDIVNLIDPIANELKSDFSNSRLREERDIQAWGPNGERRDGEESTTRLRRHGGNDEGKKERGRVWFGHLISPTL